MTKSDAEYMGASLTNGQIATLRVEAGAAGDEVMVAICRVAMTRIDSPEDVYDLHLSDEMWCALTARRVSGARGEITARDTARTACAFAIDAARANG